MSSCLNRYPDFEKINKDSQGVIAEFSKVTKNPPDCLHDRGNYNKKFRSFCNFIDRTNEKREALVKSLATILSQKTYREFTNETLQKYESFLIPYGRDSSKSNFLPFLCGAINELPTGEREKNRIISKMADTLEPIENRSFSDTDLTQALELKQKLLEMQPIIDKLLKGTHEWIVTAEASMYITKIGRIRESEGSIDAPSHRKLEETETAQKVVCKKCGQIKAPNVHTHREQK